MRKITFLLLLVLLCKFSIAQKHVGTWYDWNNIHPHEDYYVNTAGQKNGPYKEYDQGGVVIKEYNYLNGGENGLCIDYSVGDHNKRFIKSKVNYTKGVLNGLATYYDEQGLPRQGGNYVNDKKSGKWWTIAPIVVDDMPNLTEGFKFYKFEIEMKDGILQDGPVKSYYYPSGKIYTEGSLKDGQRTQELTAYYPNGKVKTMNKTNSTGDLFVYKESYYPSGKIKYYQTFHNDYRANVWITDDTLCDYKEDGAPTDYMKQQEEAYQDWKNKALANKKYEAKAEEDAKKYPGLITDADKLFAAKDYSGARKTYMEASQMKVNDKSYPLNKIKEIDGIVSAENVKKNDEMKKQSSAIDTMYLKFWNIFYVRKQVGFFLDQQGQPLMKDSYPKGENIFKRSDALLQSMFTDCKGISDYNPRMEKMKYIASVLSKLISLKDIETKEMEKEMKKAVTNDDVKKVLGL